MNVFPDNEYEYFSIVFFIVETDYSSRRDFGKKIKIQNTKQRISAAMNVYFTVMNILTKEMK